MFKTEYRVVWKRRGLKRKSKRYMSLKAAENRVKLLGPEPWTALGVMPDDYVCCRGERVDECGCMGETWREHLLGARKGAMYEGDEGMPPIEYVHIEKRPLSEWQPLGKTPSQQGESK